MEFKKLSPMLWTEQVRETISFYTEVLGFTSNVDNNVPDEALNWAALNRNGVEIMVAKPNAHFPYNGPVFTGSFYIWMDGVDVLWEALKDRVRIVYPIEDFEWQMREFAIYDNNGYIVQFGQDISCK